MTVEQAAKQHALKFKHQVSAECIENIQSDFLAGAEFALNNQWVSVEERLPEVDYKFHNSDYYMCHVDVNGRSYYLQCWYNSIDNRWTSAWPWSDNEKINVTHWQPLHKPTKQ